MTEEQKADLAETKQTSRRQKRRPRPEPEPIFAEPLEIEEAIATPERREVSARPMPRVSAVPRRGMKSAVNITR